MNGSYTKIPRRKGPRSAVRPSICCMGRRFGVAHLVRDFHALVDNLFDTAQCGSVSTAVVFYESLFESFSALERSLPTVIEGRGILLQQLGYLE